MNIKLPAYVTLTNKSKAAVKFAPYKENFNTTLGYDETIDETTGKAKGGESLVLAATTAGQVFYYLKQASDVLEVTVAETKPEGATYDVCATEAAPATVTITNKSANVMSFVPYRENFQFEVKPAHKDEEGKDVPAETYTFAATTAGQVIYYMNQDVDGLLDVTIGAVKVGKN